MLRKHVSIDSSPKLRQRVSNFPDACMMAEMSHLSIYSAFGSSAIFELAGISLRCSGLYF